MTATSSQDINIELVLEEYLAAECQRERLKISEMSKTIDTSRARLAKLEAIGRAAEVPTDYTIVEPAKAA